MRVLSVDEIAERLRDADYEVSVSHSDVLDEAMLVVEECDRDELERVLDALSGGYEVEVNLHEPGYEVFFTEDA